MIISAFLNLAQRVELVARLLLPANIYIVNERSDGQGSQKNISEDIFRSNDRVELYKFVANELTRRQKLGQYAVFVDLTARLTRKPISEEQKT